MLALEEESSVHTLYTKSSTYETCLQALFLVGSVYDVHVVLKAKHLSAMALHFAGLGLPEQALR